MKVAIVLDTWFPYIGGGQINAWEIAKRIVKKNIQIDIITRNLGKDKLKHPQNLKVIKLGSKTKPFDAISKILFTFNTFFYLINSNYDLVHGHAFLPGLSIKATQIFKRVPTVFTVHGTFIGTRLNSSLTRALEKLILTKLKYSKQITVSRDFYNVPNVNKNIAFISNGVDIKKFDEVKVKKRDIPTVIFVGRLHIQKNLEKLVEAISLFKRNIQLIIVGSGPQEEKLKKLVKKLNLESKVKFLGQVINRDLIKLYKSSHIFILTSIYEGQPLTLFEAMAAKLPVICPETGDCSYLIKESKNGLLISDAQNPVQIAKTIEKALTSKNLSQMGENGYQFVKKFTWDDAAQKTLQLYRQLIDAH